MGFDLYGIQPKITGKKPEILELSHNELDESNREEYYDTLNEWETNNPGIYFRNNVWWWRPLWSYVVDSCPFLTEDEAQAGGWNDGKEIDEIKALLIASTLEDLIETGATKKHEKEYEDNRKKIESKNKLIQNKMDKITEIVKEKYGELAPKDYPEPHRTEWTKLLESKDWGGSYPFDEDNVKKFALFCKESGGFEIY